MQISKKWLTIAGGVALVVVIGLAVGLNQGGLFKGTLTQFNTLGTTKELTTITRQTNTEGQVLDTVLTRKTDASGVSHDILVDQAVKAAFVEPLATKTASSFVGTPVMTLDMKMLKEKGYSAIYFKVQDVAPVRLTPAPEPNLSVAQPLLPIQPSADTISIAPTVDTGSITDKLSAPVESATGLTDLTISQDTGITTITDQPLTIKDSAIINKDLTLAPATDTLSVSNDLILAPAQDTAILKDITLAPALNAVDTITNTTTETRSAPSTLNLTTTDSKGTTTTTTTTTDTLAAPPASLNLRTSWIPSAHAAVGQINLTLASDNIAKLDLSQITADGDYMINLGTIGLSIPIKASGVTPLLPAAQEEIQISFGPAVTGQLLSKNSVDVKVSDTKVSSSYLTPKMVNSITYVGQIDDNADGNYVDGKENIAIASLLPSYHLMYGTQVMSPTTPINADGTITFGSSNGPGLLGVQPDQTKTMQLVADSVKPHPTLQNDVKIRFHVKEYTFTEAGVNSVNNAINNPPDIVLPKECQAIDKFAFDPMILTYDGGIATPKVQSTKMKAYESTNVLNLDLVGFCQTDLATKANLPANTTGLYLELVDQTGVVIDNESLVLAAYPADGYTNLMNGFLTSVKKVDDPNLDYVEFTNDFSKTDLGGGVTLKSGQTYTLNVKATDSNGVTSNNVTASYKLVNNAKSLTVVPRLSSTTTTTTTPSTTTTTPSTTTTTPSTTTTTTTPSTSTTPSTVNNYYYTTPATTTIPATTTTAPVAVQTPAATTSSSTPCVVGDKTFYLAGGPSSTYCKDLQVLVNTNLPTPTPTIFTLDQSGDTAQVRYTTGLATLRILKEMGATFKTRNLSSDWYMDFADSSKIAASTANEIKDFQTVFSNGVLLGRENATTGTRTLDGAGRVNYIEILAIFKQALSNGLGVTITLNKANLPESILKAYNNDPAGWQWIAEAYSFGVQYNLIEKDDYDSMTVFNYANREDMANFLSNFKTFIQKYPNLIKGTL